MKWKTKARVHAALDKVPFGGSIYYALQRHIIGSLPRKYDPKYLSYLDWHRANIVKSVGGLENVTLFEFGAGWDLFYNLGLYCYGCNRQVIVDLNRHAKIELINHEIERLKRVDDAGFTRTPNCTITRLEGLADFGIDYRAPADARETGLPEGSIDAVISTNTMEHIPFPDLTAILKEAARILKPGGIVSARVDYADHYFYADKSIGPYHYMHYSDEEFAPYNPPSHYQNRRRHSEYAALMRGAGLDVTEAQPLYEYPDQPLPDRSRLAERFRTFDDDDLRATGGLFSARRP